MEPAAGRREVELHAAARLRLVAVAEYLCFAGMRVLVVISATWLAELAADCGLGGSSSSVG